MVTTSRAPLTPFSRLPGPLAASAALTFNGPAPETINGRLAMVSASFLRHHAARPPPPCSRATTAASAHRFLKQVGFINGAIHELSGSSETLLQQVQTQLDAPTVSVLLLWVVASLIPILKGVRNNEAFGERRLRAEGRRGLAAACERGWGGAVPSRSCGVRVHMPPVGRRAIFAAGRGGQRAAGHAGDSGAGCAGARRRRHPLFLEHRICKPGAVVAHARPHFSSEAP